MAKRMKYPSFTRRLPGLTRRRFVTSAAALSGGLIFPRRSLRAAKATGERKFLFIFCEGGWDQCYCFAPLFDAENILMEDTAVEAEANGITFVDSEDRPAVRSFFETWGSRTALINGFESRSVAHDACLRLVMTGTQLPAADDWPAMLASESTADPLMPMVHISGPSYTHSFGSSVVRVGSNNQLPDLLDGSAFDSSDIPLVMPDEDTMSIEDRYTQEIAAQRVAAAGRGRALDVLGKALESEDRLDRLGELAESLDLGGGSSFAEKATILVKCFEQGVARCGLIGHKGFLDLGWDTHSANYVQSQHYEDLFGTLDTLMQELTSRTAPSGASLADETVIVVLSEMGRYPQLNSRQGKEHWTFTSAMLIGGGVAGGQMVGGYDEYASGMTTNLSSGQPDEAGEKLVPDHIGATLLALADVDPAEHLQIGPISALLAD